MNFIKASEMALKHLQQTIAYSNQEMKNLDETKHALRLVLAEQGPVRDLIELLEEEGVTGCKIEVHRGKDSKSMRTYGDCPCPTSKKGDVTLEIQ